jgi:hypothetical protein
VRAGTISAHGPWIAREVLAEGEIIAAGDDFGIGKL